MTSDELKYFLAAVQYMNFSLAAEELCISQPSLSKHIQSLENEIGVSLFNRERRSVSLTPAGVEFLKHAKALEKTYNKMFQSMKDFSPRNKQKITLASIPVMRIYDLTEVIADFKKSNPEVSVDIIEENERYVSRLLKNYKADIGYSDLISTKDTDFIVFPLSKDELVLIVSKENRFADKTTIRLSEAAEEEFLFLSSYTAASSFAIEQCSKAGFTPKRACARESNMQLETIIGLVSRGFGVSLLPMKAAEYYSNPDLRIIRLEERPAMQAGLLTRNEPIPQVCRAFISFATEYFENKQYRD